MELGEKGGPSWADNLSQESHSRGDRALAIDKVGKAVLAARRRRAVRVGVDPQEEVPHKAQGQGGEALGQAEL